MDTTLVYFSISELKIMTARHILTEAGIESFVVDKTDTVYAGLFGGGVNLYVRKEDQEKAKNILSENEILE